MHPSPPKDNLSTASKTTAAVASLSKSTPTDREKHAQQPLHYHHPNQSVQSSNLHDEGLSCLLSQLGRTNDEIRRNDLLKKRFAEVEKEHKRELTASLAKSLFSTDSKSEETYQWVKQWDQEVGAEYFYNTETGEASWVDPRVDN
jgi:hypothetical protein